MGTALQRTLRTTVALIACAAGLVIFFRSFFLSGGDLIIGDMADGQLIQSIHEHWYRVFRGLDGWLDMGFFYPVGNELGFSHTFLLSGIPYGAVRLDDSADTYAAGGIHWKLSKGLIETSRAIFFNQPNLWRTSLQHLLCGVFPFPWHINAGAVFLCHPWSEKDDRGAGSTPENLETPDSGTGSGRPMDRIIPLDLPAGSSRSGRAFHPFRARQHSASLGPVKSLRIELFMGKVQLSVLGIFC